jgi:hypothetical protein
MATIPQSISGLTLWLDGSDPLGAGSPPPYGTYITKWYDKSENGYHAIGVNNPSVVGSAVNSLSVVAYNGSSYSYAPIPAGTFSSYLTMYFVYKVTGSVTNCAPLSRAITFVGAPIDQYNSVRLLGAGVNPYYTSYTSSWSHASATSPTLMTQLIGISPPTSFSEYVNGSTSTSASGSRFSPLADNATRVYIGTRDDLSTSFNGYMCEAILYNTRPTLAQQQLIEGYLAWKWGIQSTLLIGHPYYSAPPSLTQTIDTVPRSIPSNTSLFFVNTISTVKTFMLPAVSTNQGRLLIFKDIYGTFLTNPVYLSTTGLDGFEGSVSSMTLNTNYGAWTFINDATNRWILMDSYNNTMLVSSNT